MAGGGPPGTFAIVRYVHGPRSALGQATYIPQTQYVVVDEANRIKIAEALGITDPNDQKGLNNGTVYIHPVAEHSTGGSRGNLTPPKKE